MNTVLWITGGVLLLLLFWQPQDFLSTLRTRSDSDSPSSGGQRSAPSKAPSVLKVFGLGLLALWLFAAAVGAINAFITVNKLHQGKPPRAQQEPTVVAMKPLPPKPEQHFEITVTPKSETRIHVPLGMTCITSPVEEGTNNVVWVRWEGERTRIKDWKERSGGRTKKHRGSNYVYLQAAGKNDVKVEVHIYPTEKDN